MARQISTAEMREQDIDYIVPDGMKIPTGLRKELEHRVGVRVHNAQTGETGTKYRIPAYLMRDWLQEFGQEPKPGAEPTCYNCGGSNISEVGPFDGEINESRCEDCGAGLVPAAFYGL